MAEVEHWMGELPKKRVGKDVRLRQIRHAIGEVMARYNKKYNEEKGRYGPSVFEFKGGRLVIEAKMRSELSKFK